MFFRRLKKYIVSGGPWALFFLTASVSAEYDLNLREGATTISQGAYATNISLLMFTAAISIVVFGIMFWSILRYRQSKGRDEKQFHKNTTIEILWAIIPILILVAGAAPAIKTLVDMEQTAPSEIAKPSRGDL